MKELNIVFQNEDGKLRPKKCQVEKIAKLAWEEFYLLSENPYGEHSCITDKSALMGVDASGVYRCVLFLNNANDDGIIVMDTPDDREIAYVPYAKYYAEMESHPSLKKFHKNMIDAVDEQVDKALLYQKGGKHKFPESDLYDKEPFNYGLFIDMLTERPEINMAGQDDDIIRMVIAPKFVYAEDDSHLKVITQKEFDLISAKHLLWLEEGVGQQADFSNCLLRNLEMSDRNLVNMIFDGAKIVDSRMNGADMSYSSFKATKIFSSECMELVAKECDFTGAKISNCDLTRADMSSNNFTKTAFWDCDCAGMVLCESCLEKTKFHRTDIVDSNTTDCVYDEHEWVAEKHGIKMGG